jgi:hypothetical protein
MPSQRSQTISAMKLTSPQPPLQSHTTGSEELQKPSALLPVARVQSNLHMALLSLIAAYAVSQGSHLRCRRWSS